MDKVIPNRPALFQILIIILVICFLLFTGNILPEKNKQSLENIIVSNSRPCFQNGYSLETVDYFTSQDDQFICAEVTSNSYPVRLTLIIQKEEGVYSPAYTGAGEFTKGRVMFQINPPLPAGKYKVRILYARETLSEILIEVKQ